MFTQKLSKYKNKIKNIQKGSGDSSSKNEEFLNAVKNNNEAIVQKLLKSGNIDVNKGDTWTPLIWCIVNQSVLKQNYMGMIKILVSNGADVNALSPDGSKRTAIDYAVEKKEIDIVKFLLAMRADVSLNCLDLTIHRSGLSYGEVIVALLEGRCKEGSSEPSRDSLCKHKYNVGEKVIIEFGEDLTQKAVITDLYKPNIIHGCVYLVTLIGGAYNGEKNIQVYESDIISRANEDGGGGGGGAPAREDVSSVVTPILIIDDDTGNQIKVDMDDAHKIELGLNVSSKGREWSYIGDMLVAFRNNKLYKFTVKSDQLIFLERLLALTNWRDARKL
jgi:ankyrin repeat protein